MVDFAKHQGLVPAIVQDAATGEVLMLGWMNEEALAETMRTGYACYYSRSRKKLWRKGEESGHVQQVVGIYLDCDADTLLVRVRQTGVACHEGYRSCFFRQWDQGEWRTVAERVLDPKTVYRPHESSTGRG
ncbi:MAG: phosphoribosyl-AMP cyclohydrolase [Gemmataceae bacterium]